MIEDSSLSAAAELPPLVMRFGAFGDMVLLTILLRHLYERFGKPVDVISSGPWTPPLLEGQPWLGRLFMVRSRRTPYWMSLDQQRLVSWLRRRGAGPTWFCDMHLGKDLLHRGGIPDEYICDSRSLEWRPDEGFADRYIRMGNESPIAFGGRLPPARPASSRAAELLSPTPLGPKRMSGWLDVGLRVGLTSSFIPGAGTSRAGLFARAWGQKKYWPEDRWAQVIQSLRDLRPDHALLLTGTRAESKFNAAIVACSEATDVHDVADELPVRTLLPLLERAHSMISVDTGPAHAAAALGTPTVALFGPANSTLFRPGGATTHAVALTGIVDGAQNILGITAESVIAAWFELVRSTEVPSEYSVKSLT